MRLRPLAAIVVVPLALGSLAACGSTKKSNDLATLVKDARSALVSLKTVHVKGNVQASGNTTAMDLSISTTGSCMGTVTFVGQTMSVIEVAGTYYLRAPKAFWTMQMNAKAAAKAANTWVTGLPPGIFDSFCNLATFAKSAASDPILSGEPKVLGALTVNGSPVTNLQVNSQRGNAVLSITKSSPHYLVKVVLTDGSMSEEFSEFDQPINVSAPAGAITMSSLK